VNGIDSGICPISGFDINGVETLDSTARELAV
jgi:hypothetical protein